MLRSVLRSLLIAYVSIEASRKVIGGFDFGKNEFSTLAMIVLAIALLNIFMVPVFKIISLPAVGIAFLFLNFMLTLVTLHVLTLFIPSFEIISTRLGQLKIFGVLLPSKDLTVFWSAVFSALAISICYYALDWVCDRK